MNNMDESMIEMTRNDICLDWLDYAQSRNTQSNFQKALSWYEEMK